MNVSKWILIVVLVLMLAGVAYIKAVYSNQDRSQSEITTLDQSQADDLDDTYISREDHERFVDSLRNVLLDSLTTINSLATGAEAVISQEMADSLTAEIKSVSRQLSALDKSFAELKRSKTRQFNKLVYSFYSNEMAALPADLSAYERKVSVREIKDKARKYFGLSADALNKIIRQQKK
ncbi:MAG: hypothetical protein GY841_08785 [FCB group bacterium]|nr:hypothetical protein [FCB group bacterium]